jgi:cellulose synthase/poly-beta-1,6-N-acetylglucosamine synthase-like glycosyltransferase
MTVLTGAFLALGLVTFLFGLQSLFFFPLTILYEFWKRRFFARWGEQYAPFVSVVVPAFNEEKTVVLTIQSILASDYPRFEVIVVNDGSTDATGELLRPFAAAGRIVSIEKANGGKASALNAGIAKARGEVILFTDADSMFQPRTLARAARWFVDPDIHAVCGNDTPVRPDTPLQKLLTLTTHVGTGFVRRAFSILNVMPIISGNTGAVRKEWLERVGGFREVWGEDLDLTFKLQRARARIIYDGDAMVMCDVPRDFPSLWRQRVRWMRSYLTITAAHRDLFFRRDYFPFSWFLPVNWFSMVGIPILQLLLAIGLPFALSFGVVTLGGPLDAIAFLGYGMFAAIVVYSALLDREPGHLKYFPLYGWLIIPLSYFYNGVVVYSLYAELRGAAARWEKRERRDLSVAPARRRSIRANLAQGVAPVLATLGVAWIIMRAGEFSSGAPLPPVTQGQTQITLATHFDAWTRPADALTSILRREGSSIVTAIGLGAGREEWNFFRWEGHEETWSNDQRVAKADLLADAVMTMRKNGRRIISIVDLYAPKYIGEHPDAAARGSDGSVSAEQVCFTELVAGEYGRRIKEMVGYLSRTYDIEGISLTELEYDRYCYDERCRESYRAYAGREGWPTSFFGGGGIDRNVRSVGEWRSALMARFLHELADSAHAYGKKLYIDVPIHYDRLRDEGMSSGLYYPGLLAFADGLVVWDYFYLEGRSPSTSQEVAKFFVTRYGADRIIMSVGLWGKGTPVSPDELAGAVRYSLAGGAQRLWITPNHLITEEHWKALREVYAH